MRTLPGRLIAATLVLAAAVACGGSSGDKAAYDRRKAICDGLQTGPTAAKVSDIAAQFGSSAFIRAGSGECVPALPRLLPIPGGDSCNYDLPICFTFFEYVAGDPDLCDSGRCVYYCEVRSQADPLPAANEISAAPACARQWVRGQDRF
jgi:hypothetical protein